MNLLQSHMKTNHDSFEETFSTMSLLSDGSLSDISETCSQCGNIFENKLDLENNKVHEYGELFQLYPCAECGFRGIDMKEIKDHI